MLACQNCSVRFCSFHVEELHRARSLVRIDPIGIKLKKIDKWVRTRNSYAQRIQSVLPNYSFIRLPNTGAANPVSINLLKIPNAIASTHTWENF